MGDDESRFRLGGMRVIDIFSVFVVFELSRYASFDSEERAKGRMGLYMPLITLSFFSDRHDHLLIFSS